MLSGTRGWQDSKAVFPTAPAVARVLEGWLVDAEDGPLNAADLDLRGADLSGGDFSLGWFMDAVLTGVSLAGADLYRANCERADNGGLSRELDGAELAQWLNDRGAQVEVIGSCQGS